MNAFGGFAVCEVSFFSSLGLPGRSCPAALWWFPLPQLAVGPGWLVRPRLLGRGSLRSVFGVRAGAAALQKLLWIAVQRSVLCL